MNPPDAEATYLLIDGENIDATLGLSVLDRRPTPDERPRWDRIRDRPSSSGISKCAAFSTSMEPRVTFPWALFKRSMQWGTALFP